MENPHISVDWRGYWVACPTPFTVEGSIDFNSMKALLDLYISQRVHGIVVNGSTGEWCSQSIAERKKLAAVAVEHIAGRIPCVIGTSSYTANQVIDLANQAFSVGANGVMVTPTPYYNLIESEILKFFQTIENQVSIPIMVYNWPRGVGVDMSEDLLVKIGNLTQVVAIKESSGDEKKTINVLKRLLTELVKVKFFARFVHPQGAEYLRTIGGDGNIDGGGLGAQYAVKFYNSWWQNDLAIMNRNSVAYADFASQLVNSDYSGKYGSPVSQLKACMRILGQPGGYVRPPLMDIDDPDVMTQLKDILQKSAIRCSEKFETGEIGAQ